MFVNRKKKGEIGYTQVERESPVTIVKISENPIIGGGLFCVCVCVIKASRRHHNDKKRGGKNIPVKETIREREREKRLQSDCAKATQGSRCCNGEGVIS